MKWVKSLRQRVFKTIPNIFTLGNLYCGFLSISFAAAGSYKNAAILILIGMMLDSMDGRLARMLEADSAIGKELDSLADIVTFGIAPSFLLYYTYFYQFELWGIVVAGLFPLFGAYRLARFNVTPAKISQDYFIGVPITAAGGILALLTLFREFLPNILIAVVFTALAFLMVSRMKIPSFKEVPLPKYGTIITIFLGALLVVIYRGTYHETPFLIYVAVPLYFAFIAYRFVKKKGRKKTVS